MLEIRSSVFGDLLNCGPQSKDDVMTTSLLQEYISFICWTLCHSIYKTGSLILVIIPSYQGGLIDALSFEGSVAWTPDDGVADVSLYRRELLNFLVPLRLMV